MSIAKVVQIIDENSNEYTIFVPGIGNVKGQCISADVIQPGTPVRIVDLNNESPNVTRQAGLRFLPNIIDGQMEPEPLPNIQYPPYTIWKSVQEMDSAPHSLTLGYFFSSNENKKWQAEYPLYKKGRVTKIIDENYFEVFIYGDTTRTCLCVYMTCNTIAFSEDDEIVVFYENGDFNSPVGIGFWNDPKTCITNQIMVIAVKGGPIPGEPPAAVLPRIYITNIEFFTTTWESRMGPDYWDDFEWDGSKYILELPLSGSSRTYTPVGDWYRDMLRTSKLRITFAYLNPDSGNFFRPRIVSGFEEACRHTQLNDNYETGGIMDINWRTCYNLA